MLPGSRRSAYVAARSAARLRWHWVLVAFVLAGLVGWWQPAGDRGPIAAFERTTIDWRFAIRGALAPPVDVVVLAIDDATLAKLGRFPIPRATIARIVDRLDHLAVRAVGLDLLLVEVEPPSDGNVLSSGDLALRDALARSDRDVLAMALAFGPGELSTDKMDAVRAMALPVVERAPAPDGAGRSGVRDAYLPLAAFRDHAELGHVNVEGDPDGVLRRFSVALTVRDAALPSLPLALAIRASGLRRGEAVLRSGREVRLGEQRLPLAADDTIALNHYGPRGTMTTYSLLDLLDQRIGTAELAGKVVLVGATALGVGDSFATPYSRDVPGVEVLATALSNILAGDVLVRDWRVRLMDMAVLAVTAVLTFFAANGRLLPICFFLVGGLIACWSALALLMFLRAGWLVGAVEPVMTSLAVALIVIGARFRAQRIDGRRLASERANLVQYQSPVIAEVLARGEAPAFDGRAQEATVLFVDVAGYTARSERLGPERTVAFLRALHGRLEQAALAHGGLIEQFMGDGAMLIFGLPTPMPTDAASALGFARDFLISVAAWNQALAAESEPPVRVRIGVHCGPVVVARLGGERQRHVSVAGDTVNVASRLEQLARVKQTPILISTAVADAVCAVGRAELLAGFVQTAPELIRGRSNPLPLWAYAAGD